MELECIESWPGRPPPRLQEDEAQPEPGSETEPLRERAPVDVEDTDMEQFVSADSVAPDSPSGGSNTGDEIEIRHVRKSARPRANGGLSDPDLRNQSTNSSAHSDEDSSTFVTGEPESGAHAGLYVRVPALPQHVKDKYHFLPGHSEVRRVLALHTNNQYLVKLGSGETDSVSLSSSSPHSLFISHLEFLTPTGLGRMRPGHELMFHPIHAVDVWTDALTIAAH